MSGIGFVADVHVSNHRRFSGPAVAGVNRRARLVLDALAEAVRVAADRGLDALVVCGDLFDTVHPEPQVIREVQRILGSLDGDGCEVVFLVGNHDQVSTFSGDHALGPLMPCGLVVERPTVLRRRGYNLIAVPFLSGAATETLEPAVAHALSEFDGQSAEPSLSPRLLALHCGISDDDTPPWLRGSLDSIPVEVLADICDRYNIKAAFAGNWHDHKSYGSDGRKFDHIVQVGALAPTGFDNPGLDGYGTVAIWKDGDLDLVQVSGPRFVKVRTDQELTDLTLRLPTPNGDKVFVSMLELPERLGARHAQLAMMQTAGLLEDYEVLPDDQVAKAQARTAAQVAQRSDTMLEAVEKYIGEMPIDLPVEDAANPVEMPPLQDIRKAVLQRSKTYLGL